MSSYDQTFPKGLCVQPQNNWHMAISSHFVFHVSWRVNIAMVVGNLKILTTLQSYWERGENVKKVYFRTCWLKSFIEKQKLLVNTYFIHSTSKLVPNTYLFLVEVISGPLFRRSALAVILPLHAAERSRSAVLHFHETLSKIKIII